MILAGLAVAAALMTPAAVQTLPASGVRPALPVEIPEIAGVSADPGCGGRAALAQQALCLLTTQAGVEGVMDAFDAAFTRQGWLAAGGRDNLIVYVKRKETGGCDAFQVLAFAPRDAVPAPAGPASIAVATIPGDVCQTPEPAAQ